MLVGIIWKVKFERKRAVVPLKGITQSEISLSWIQDQGDLPDLQGSGQISEMGTLCVPHRASCSEKIMMLTRR